jgi:hypothetical protein
MAVYQIHVKIVELVLPKLMAHLLVVSAQQLLLELSVKVFFNFSHRIYNQQF